MRLVSCLDPQTVVNPYTHERLTVACGKCAACRNRHASFWVKRLRAEQRSWRFCMFVTLKYDDCHLPTLHMDDVLDLAVDQKTGFAIPISELITKDAKSNKYMFSRLRTFLGLPYCSTDIIQKFHKRLNKYIHDNYTQKYQNFRYFLATEYGGTTFRTHHHGLYFFNDARVAADFKNILAKTWQQSYYVEESIDAQQVTGNAASYVAQYINCFTHYPEVYKNPKLRPKYFFSKSPSLGSLEPLDESLRELFFRCSPCRYEYNVGRNTYDFVRIPFQVENRLYPRIPRFREAVHYARVKLYGLSGRSGTFQDFKNTLLAFKRSLDIFSEVDKIQKNINCDVFSYLNWLTNGFKFNRSDYASLVTYKTVQNRVLRFFYLTRRVNVQCQQFGVGLSYYLRLIDKYYSNLDYYHLKHFYDLQQSYSLAHCTDDLSLMYSEPLDYNHAYCSDVLPDLKNTYAWRDLFQTSKAIEEKNTKTHRKNEYLDTMRDKSLSLILKSYFNG